MTTTPELPTTSSPDLPADLLQMIRTSIRIEEAPSSGPNWVRAIAAAHHAGALHCCTDSFPGRKDALDVLSALPGIVLCSTSGGLVSDIGASGSVTMLLGDTVAWGWSRGRGMFELAVWARSPEQAHTCFSTLHRATKATDSGDERPTVLTHFWHSGKNGASFYSRKIAAPALDDVLAAQPATTREGLQALAGAAPAGGLNVWIGEPGCGKTTSIRALAHAWREHFSLEVILDPEHFLADASYMLGVLQAPTRADRPGVAPAPGRPRRLLVLEDAGELVGVDARREAGQGLSRLLNLADGMFGQGEAPVMIITTNEPIKRLHPAVLRPGRCRSIIEFGPLDLAAARAWLEAQGAQPDLATGAMTIAELAAIASRSQPIDVTGAGRRAGTARTLGFAGTQN